jgi:hypothetical protein
MHELLKFEQLVFSIDVHVYGVYFFVGIHSICIDDFLFRCEIYVEGDIWKEKLPLWPSSVIVLEERGPEQSVIANCLTLQIFFSILLHHFTLLGGELGSWCHSKTHLLFKNKISHTLDVY